MILPILNISLYTFFSSLILILLLIAILFFVILYASTNDTISIITRYQKEKSYCLPDKKDRKDFPFNQQEGDVSLSVIVPAYNEEERLPIMLDETFEYLENRQTNDKTFTYEIIVVDDGSKDKTTQVGLEYVKKYDPLKIKVLTFSKNRGKGGAVRMGVLCSRGKKILFVDADGATRFSDLDGVEKGLDELHGGNNGMAISVGSRAHLQDDAVAQRSVFRNVLMWGFHFLVYFLCVKGIKDTQCGFKLLTRKAALRLFSSLHVERWAFDVELLYLAQLLKIPIAEKAVNWQEIDGSKMVPIFSWLQMGRDLILIRARYVIGAWKMSDEGPNVVDL